MPRQKLRAAIVADDAFAAGLGERHTTTMVTTVVVSTIAVMTAGTTAARTTGVASDSQMKINNFFHIIPF